MKVDNYQVSVNGNNHIIGIEKRFLQTKQRIFLDGSLCLMHERKHSEGHTLYNISVEGKQVILDIFTDDTGIKSHDVYIDGYSVNDGRSIEEMSASNEEIASKGFKQYFKLNKEKSFKELLVFISTITLVNLLNWGLYGIGLNDLIRIVLICYLICIPLFMGINLLVLWIHYKKKLKEWDK